MQLTEKEKLQVQAATLDDLANEWAQMGSDTITVNDLRQRAGRFKRKLRDTADDSKSK